MKRLTCEMCGSTDLVKQDGVFVCQSCGCKYSLEEARKMMVEGTVEVTGTVKVDNTAAIDNYLKMARNALEASNHEEAENYANKIIEIDPRNSAAWEIKGTAAGWQSKANNNRMNESVTAWLNAIEYASEDEVDDLRQRVANGYADLFLAMVQLRANSFAKIQSDEYLNSTLRDIDNGADMMNTLMAKGGVSFDRAPIYTQIAKKINEAAVAGYKDAKDDFGPEHHNMSKWQWNNFTNSCDNCIKLLDKAAGYCRSRTLGQTICDNLVYIQSDAKDSSSWKFNSNSWNADHYDKDFSFTSEAKAARANMISRYKQKKAFFAEDLIEKNLNAVQGGRKAEEIDRAKKAYWQEHASEKTQLESEKDELTKTIKEKEEMLKTLPVLTEISDITEKISALSGRKASLGIFKGREKKELQDQIDELELTKKQKITQSEEEKKPLNAAIAQSQSRLAMIDEELTKERGYLPASAGENYFPGAIVDGKFAITPQQLADHLAKILPKEFECRGVDDMGSEIKDFGHQVGLKIVLAGKDEKNNNTGVPVYCTADDKDSVIRNIIIAGISGPLGDADEGKKETWAIIGSYILMSLFEGMEQSEAEKCILKMLFGEDSTLWTREGLRCEYANSRINFGGLLTINRDNIIIRPLKG